ncbi:PPOX class F420-dependent enzyme [Candidatus Dormiibacter inghamiae]|uniref:PPOX class F420-dependent enzyme n=1 Tax=Candidatus Dormiibacter inghamiae TaxID=3127013 RepID=UPI0033130052
MGVEGDELVVASIPRNQKVRNRERDGRICLSIATGRKADNSLDEYLVVHGTARVTAGGAPEVLQRLAEVYIGPGVKFPALPDPPPGYVIRITPERFSGNGPWT